jgi:uncharacterized protein GlcG (DUF336 family)
MSVTRISPTTVPSGDALDAIAAGVAHGEALGLPFTIVVIDTTALPVAQRRMDGAALASVETSLAKARTALLFAQPTADLAAAIQPGAPLFTIETSTTAPLAFVPGGVPLADAEGVVVGAVGAGGGTPDQDHEVATVVAEHLSAARA